MFFPTSTTLTNKPLIKKVFSFVIIIFLTFFVVKNAYSQSGIFQTHDGEVHVIRSLHFFSELKKGQFPVRVVPDLAYQYSYPVFQFFYPLPYYVVAIFQLIGFSTTQSWRLALTSSTFLSLWFFFKWMRCSVKQNSALIATTVYALVPFRFLTIFVTGQVGGYFSLVFAPLIAWGLYQLLDKTKNHTTGGIMVAIGIAGMITSHLLSVIIFFLTLASYGLYLLLTNFSWKNFRRLLLWIIIGLGLSSFYLIPFLAEKSSVKLGQEILINHRDHWPTFSQLIYSPWGHGFSQTDSADGLSFQVGVVVLASWVISLLLYLRNKKNNQIALVFLLTGAFSFFLMLKQSSSIWEILFPLQYLQYPWRLLAATTFIGAWLAGWSLDNLPNKKGAILSIFLVTIALINIRNYTKPWPLDWKTDQDFIANKQSYYSSTDISWELMPANATEVPQELGDEIVADGQDVIVSYISRPNSGDTKLRFTVKSDQPAKLILPVWRYPYWSVKVNEEVVKTDSNEGKIEIEIKPGNSAVELILIKTLIQKIADVTSIVFFAIIVIITLKKAKNGSKL